MAIEKRITERVDRHKEPMEQEAHYPNTRKFSKDLRFRETIVIGSGINASHLITTLPFNGLQANVVLMNEHQSSTQMRLELTNPYKDIDFNELGRTPFFMKKEKVGERKPITKKERLKRNKARKAKQKARRIK